MHCVVVGGGLAGLASAVWLSEAGQRVTLLERRGSLGGRTISMPLHAVDDVPVIGDVGEFEALHGLPQRRVERVV